jgi:hypothetical protein
MTDRIRTLQVLLDRDTRTDDADHYKQVIGAIKGVASVVEGDVVGLEEHLHREATLNEFSRLLAEFVSLGTNYSNTPEWEAVKTALDTSFRRKYGRSLLK